MREWMMRRFSLAAGAAFLVFLTSASADTPHKSVDEDTFKALDLFGEVFDRVRQDYVTPISDKELVEDALNGMLTALDPHSSYLNAKEYADMQVTTQGEFGGLGVEVTQDNGLIKIVSPMDDTPGAKAGLKPNDYIVAIDGQLVMNMSLNDAINKMRGLPDTAIKLTIRREGVPAFDVTLKRAIIHLTSSRGKLMRNEIAYLRISSFSEHTNDEMVAAFKKIKTEQPKITGVVLDLRNNPGGLLDQAVSVSDSFLEHGEIVSTRGRNPGDVQRFNAHSGDMTNGVPIVVLINGGTASAAEIVSGALQDHHRGAILGTKSFGKGSVQTIIPLPSNGGAMRLTTARYYTPSGRSIQGQGIVPDIVVDQAKVEKIGGPEFLRESDLKGALKNTGSDSGGDADKNKTDEAKTPDDQSSSTAPAAAPEVVKTADGKPGDTKKPAAAGPNMQPGSLSEADDYQLARALDLIKGIALFQPHAVD